MPEPVDPSSAEVSPGHLLETKRPVPPALEADTPRLVLIGTALWAVALVVGLVADRGSTWTWTCVVGMVLGALGYVLAKRAARPRR